MKNFTKRAISVLAVSALSVTSAIGAFASKFPDVTEENYPWAIESIESMASEGIIKGYEDGSFNPARTVSKFEALILVSRILGFNDKINTKLVDASWDAYCEEIDKNNLEYGEREIAYLISKGVISVSELDEYISENNRNDGLKRYEVAKLLTKAMDGERHITSSSVSTLTYADNEDIPASAKKYVAFVTQNNLMQGMDGNRFAPNETVTRAQIAVVLHKLQKLTDYEYKSGIVSSMDTTNRMINIIQPDGTFISHHVPSEVILRYNGITIGINDIEVGYETVISYKSGKLYALDFSDPLVDEIVYGSFVGSKSSSVKGVSINIHKLDENDTELSTEDISSYKLSDECVITYNDTTCSVSSLKSGTYVKLTVNKGIVTFIEAENKDKKINGRVNEVILDPVYKLKIEEDGGEVKDYLVSSTVSVTRNNKKASARDILAGDKVSLSLTYDRIKTIKASSKASDKTGVIKEVIISSTPKITMTVNGVDTTYYVRSDASILISDVKSTFYDLRVGLMASVKLEGDTIVALETVKNDEVHTLAGTVSLVNSSYGLIQIEVIDPITAEKRIESVYVKDNASIVDYETQRNKKLSEIKSGMKVNVTGSVQSGVFEAGTVIIIER